MKFSALLLVVFVAACATSGRQAPSEKIYWPKKPNIPRYVHETTLRSSANIKVSSDADKLQDLMLGLSPSKKDAFGKPYDIAARFGRILITDSVTRAALMFNIPERKAYPIGVRDGDGELKKPMGVAIDGNKFLYIADVSDQVVRVYDPLGRFMRFIGKKGDFVRPVDVAVDEKGERIYVVDAGGIESDRHEVTIFDRAGKPLRVIGGRGGNEGEFNLPIQAAVASDGTLYVLDAGNFRVQAFDRDGNFLRMFGKVGRNFGDFARPRGIAVDTFGNIYVTDATFRNFQVFTPQGKLLMWIGNAGLFDTPGNIILPAGIAVDETNRVYVVDQLMRKIEVYKKLTENEIARLVPGYVMVVPPTQAAETATTATTTTNEPTQESAVDGQQKNSKLEPPS
ncbi:MAG: SBBP repeat-containing protein [Thiohalomonadales bacterium]